MMRKMSLVPKALDELMKIYDKLYRSYYYVEDAIREYVHAKYLFLETTRNPRIVSETQDWIERARSSVSEACRWVNALIYAIQRVEAYKRRLRRGIILRF